jgi:hypothetical protein
MGIRDKKTAIATRLPEPKEKALRQNVVVVIAIAKGEGRELLSDPQYLYVTDILKRLVYFLEPSEINDLSIDSVEDFYELRLRGTALGKKNIRIYFSYFKDTNEVVVVRVWQKDNQDKTPQFIKVNVRTRLRRYREGEFQVNLTRYTKPE